MWVKFWPREAALDSDAGRSFSRGDHSVTLFSPSSRALTRAEVRLINPRRWLMPALAIGLVLNLTVFAGGVWLGSTLREPLPELAEADATPAAERSFTIDRLGVLVGRLKALESDVLSLHGMLVEQRTLTSQVSSLDPTLVPSLLPDKSAADGKGQGGLLLPPRSCEESEVDVEAAPLEGLRHGEAVASCLRRELDRLLEGVAERNAALMAIPAWRPVPEDARLVSNFGNRIDPFRKQLAFHAGVDFAIASGAPVYAAAGGKVRFAGRRGAFGNLIEIAHGNGLVTRYAHLSRIGVRNGEVVTPGQAIGAVGSTGRSTGAHLHFEVLRNGRYLDPRRFLALAEMERDIDALAFD